ncbi:hypothetical protein LGR54_10675 [Ancylobacter sp. Lp-2]|uniref:hypothetical protein n=1 Tax=Ancylobacter sp. Lp-2 TaxID=2881339 RepID=UPI001E4F3702|nr:hypothetical protein [Ancylobacter sp. Lp-2]MCB4769067.1 hypothetical protein [Ancylobacter sp. Lp-2]
MYYRNLHEMPPICHAIWSTKVHSDTADLAKTTTQRADHTPPVARRIFGRSLDRQISARMSRNRYTTFEYLLANKKFISSKSDDKHQNSDALPK